MATSSFPDLVRNNVVVVVGDDRELEKIHHIDDMELDIPLLVLAIVVVVVDFAVFERLAPGSRWAAREDQQLRGGHGMEVLKRCL